MDWHVLHMMHATTYVPVYSTEYNPLHDLHFTGRTRKGNNVLYNNDSYIESKFMKSMP